MTAPGRRSSGITASASTPPPTGRVAAPAKATRPFIPTRNPGVISPWMQSSAAIDENAVPIRTDRASPRRAPETVRTTAAAAARPALMPSAKKWKPLGISTCVSPKKWMMAPGTTAHAASRASRETVRCRRRRPIAKSYRTPLDGS